MTGPEMLAISLLLSIAVSGAVWGAGALVERFCRDPRLRDAIWGAGLGLSVLPVLAIALLLLTPTPVREVVAVAVPVAAVQTIATVPTQAAPIAAPRLDSGLLAWTALALAGAFSLIRLVALALRALRLARLIACAAPAEPDLRTRVETLSARLKIAAPRAVISPTASEALLAGLGRPCLVLPLSESATDDAVIAHELAHLKRGDHRTLWLEEALAVVLAFNPLISLLRARRDAAREEACDALALAGAPTETRRAYAQTLIQALRDRAGPQAPGGPRVALTFTGAGRTIAMHRLNAVMTPAAPAGRLARMIALSLTVGLVATVATASWAVADQRPIRTVTRADSGSAPSTLDFAYVSAALIRSIGPPGPRPAASARRMTAGSLSTPAPARPATARRSRS
ncbi:M56 family metallopeptidase [Brevundimonas staleyi]|uniref:M56 family metallopeptidase n=1 Tax=Brevundimonas staleyi TaxID=74326 RepID=A0ABW0FS36_9CAUL